MRTRSWSVPLGRRLTTAQGGAFLMVGAAMAGAALVVTIPVAGALFAAVVLTVAPGVLIHRRLLRSMGPGSPRRATTGDEGARGEPLLVRLARGLFLVGVFLSTFIALRPHPNLTYGDVAFVGAAVLVAVSAIPRVVRLSLPRWLLLAAWLIAGAAISRAMLGWGGAAQLVPAVFLIVSMVGVTVLALWLLTRRRHVTAALSFLVLSALVNATVGIFAQLGFIDFSSRLMRWPIAGQQNGLTGHPNHLGLVCMIGLAGLWGLRRWAVAGRAPFDGARGLAVAAVLVGGVLVSGSRAALIAVFALWLWLVGLDYVSRRRLLVFGVVTAMALGAVLLFRPLSENVTHRDRTFSVLAERALVPEVTQGSNEARVENVRLASREFATAPFFGVGFASARLAHNIYLQLLHAGGVIALMGFATYIINVVVRGLLLVRGRPDLRELALGVTGATAVWLATGLVQNHLYDRYLYVAPALVVALFTIDGRLRAGSSPVGPPADELHHRWA